MKLFTCRRKQKAKHIYMSSILVELPVADVLDTLRDLGFSAAHWRKLGMRLVSSSVLSSIAASYSTAEECLERMITEWRRGSVRANWQTLAEAIAQCHGGRQKLKMQLLKKVGIGTECCV